MGNLSTPNGVQKLQKALHAKAKAEAGYRFYALYDKISREDILAHAYAQCRSNKLIYDRFREFRLPACQKRCRQHGVAATDRPDRPAQPKDEIWADKNRPVPW